MKNLLFVFTLLSSVYSVAQSGITWNSGLNIAANTYSNMHPRLCVDGSGNPMVIWGRMNDQSVFFSKWNGSTFSTPLKLNDTLTIATASWMGPDIASHGDTVYVVMKQTPEADTSSHIYLVRSFDGGITYSLPQRVDFIADSISRFPTITTDSAGNPVVAFMKFNNSFMESRWVVLKSTDYGATFSIDVKASGWGGSGGVCDCCPGAVISSGNNCAMLYRDNNANIRDIWMGVSNDYGSTFTNGCNIDNNNWLIMSCPSTGPDAVTINDTLYSTFMNGAGGNAKCYFSKASLNNVALTSVAPLTGSIPGLTQQNFPRIASHGSALAIVWKQVISGNTMLPVLFTNDISNGLPSVYDTVDLNNITNADVALSNGSIYVVWQDDGSQTVKFYYGTFVPVSTGITSPNQNEKQDVTIFPNPVSNVLNITSSSEISSVCIFNHFGEMVYSASLDIQSLPFTTRKINLQNFSAGIYFINIAAGNSFYNHKFIKE